MLAFKCNKKIEEAKIGILPIAKVNRSANNDTSYASVTNCENNEDNDMRNETDDHNIIRNCNTDGIIENIVSDIGNFIN